VRREHPPISDLSLGGGEGGSLNFFNIEMCRPLEFVAIRI